MIVDSTITFQSNVAFLVTSNEKLSIKASNQLPEFYQEEFPTFQKFIELYYKFQSNSKSGYLNIEDIKDIDSIGQLYLDAFYRTMAKDMPVFPYISMADFIRNAKRFYISRGSEESYRFLFKIMFDIDIDFKYPKENILIPSSGEWNQRISIYVTVLDGVMDRSIIGHKVRIKDSSGLTTSILIKNITQLSDGNWELDIDKFIQQPISVGNRVFAKQNPITLDYDLTCEVVSTLNTYEINDGGSGFKVGKIFNITTPAGQVDIIVTAIYPDNGAIKRIEFLEFTNTTNIQHTAVIEDATITFSSDSINRYYGFYDDRDGFLSDNTKLQDSFYYQIFSYVIKSNISRELYQDVVQKILHPTGLIMFSELDNNNVYEHSMEVIDTFDRMLDMFDVININDTYQRKYIGKRKIQDTILIYDTITKKISKNFSDSVTSSDSGGMKHWEATDYVDPGYTDGELYTTKNLNEQSF